MDDLISRQAAIDVLDVLCEEHRYRIPGKGETYSEYNKAWQDALGRAEGLIFDLPSTQKKGRWVHDGYDFPGGVDWIHCSECGKRGINVPADLSNYCPNCGACMKGEQDEAD